mgnify:CR=1 FL=1
MVGPTTSVSKDKKDAIYPTKFMENKDVIFFRFMTNVYNDKQKTYNALYRKADGTVKVCPFDERITDDMNGFLPLQPISVSSSGEFAPFSLRKKSYPGSKITPVKRISRLGWPP